MRLAAAWRNTVGQAGHRRRRRDAMQIGEHLAGADRRQLVGVADDEQRGGCAAPRARSACISGTSTIDASSTTSRSPSSGMPLVAAEAAVARVHFEQAMDRARLEAGDLGQPLRRAAGRRAEQQRVGIQLPEVEREIRWP